MAARKKRQVDAESAPVTVAEGMHTHGVLNQHPNSFRSQGSSDGSGASKPEASSGLAFRIGFAEDPNSRFRRAMEDAHAFVYDFGDVPGQGFFGIFDGHAGKDSAEWCGRNFHQVSPWMRHRLTPTAQPKTLLTLSTFELANLATQTGTSSGCTAAVAFLRVEDDAGSKGDQASSEDTAPAAEGTTERAQSGTGLWGKISKRFESSDHAEQAQPRQAAKRVLYTANVGDTRAVLCRNGQAVRLTYDHKGSDAQEAKRITDAGGFVMNNRVNGVLAVTRSLGDSNMKEFVVGSPYTTETVLGSEDSFLIIACDGLWDVAEDQEAVDRIRDIQDPQQAAEKLVQHALSEFSTDNTSIMVIRFAQ
ncbi:hypothetical protein PANT_12d00022 [Moesziomyces antarcticus T-34]|uniref:PPM-type phosphatase domain-containing protein n=1 Tax=Pseudozyma antarctica (strain T-34) TaxID=1151754 RepID=M9LQ88_PSEA3|nr:hypothetical protein PANT_12d00022 [Moesziomyces antarcticus T-34]